MRVAAREYHDLFWEDMRTDLERDGIAFNSLVLAYTMANLDRWPESCSRKAGSPSLEDFQAIGTDLKISTCDADLLVLAAHQLVHDPMNGETGRRLEKLGISVRRVDERVKVRDVFSPRIVLSVSIPVIGAIVCLSGSDRLQT